LYTRVYHWLADSALRQKELDVLKELLSEKGQRATNVSGKGLRSLARVQLVFAPITCWSVFLVLRLEFPWAASAIGARTPLIEWAAEIACILSGGAVLLRYRVALWKRILLLLLYFAAMDFVLVGIAILVIGPLYGYHM